MSRKLIFAILMLAAIPALAAVTVTVNGSSHTIPQTNEKGWGTNVTAWIQAISQYTLQPSGGTFTLTADTDFGATYGLKSAYFKTRSSNPAGAGLFRLSNNESIGWRNAANSGNILLKVNSSDQLEYNGVVLAGSSGATFQDSTFSVFDNLDSTKKIAFQASGITTGTTRTVTMADADVDLADVSGATNANTASKIVKRDGSGNFSAGTITASLSGNVTGNVTGAVTGNASTATALAANGTNCSAGQYPLGVDASGNAESCAAITTLGTIGTGIWGTNFLADANGTRDLGSTSYYWQNLFLNGYADLKHIAAPASPSAGAIRVYAKSDNLLYIKNSSGAETAVGTGSGSGTGAYASVLTNSSFSSGATCDTGWTSAAGTDSCDSTTYIEGSKALSISLTSVNGTVISQSVTPGVSLAGNNLEYSVWVYTTSTNINICALQAGSEIQCVAPTVTSQWQRLLMQIAAPSSGTIGLKLKTLSSTTATVKLDDAYVGPARFAYPVNAKLATTVSVKTSGTNTAYTPPAGVTSLRIKMAGGGGGGSGGGTGSWGVPASDGGATCFGTNATACTSPILQAGGGTKGGSPTCTPASGGSVTINSPAIGQGYAGSKGGAGGINAASMLGGFGGGTPLAGPSTGSTGSSNGVANSGAGGSGGYSGSAAGGYGGCGGGAGAYLEAKIQYPNIASTYYFTIGAGSAGGAAGSGTGAAAGGSGADGVIEIWEDYDLTVTAINLANSADVLGSVFWSGSATCPQGSLAADGSAVSRTTYAALYTRIGTTFGTGDGSTTFNLPDTRGIFIKGAGTTSRTAGKDSSGNFYAGTLGTYSTDMMQGHKHSSASTLLSGNGLGSYGASSSNWQLTDAGIGSPTTDGTNGTPRTGHTTEPQSIGLTGCIYYVSNPVPMVTQSVIAKDNTTGVTVVNTINALTSNTTLDDNYETVYGNTSGGAFTITLPTAVGRQGKKYIIDKGDTSASLLSIATTSSQTIQSTGGTVTAMKLHRPGDPVTFQSDGSGWRIVGGGAERIERALLSCGVASSITSQGGAWVSSIGNASSSQCTITLVSGIFSSTPACFAHTKTSGVSVTYGNTVSVNSATSLTVAGFYNNGGTTTGDSNFTIELVCYGPR